jgi:hypothetical protein
MTNPDPFKAYLQELHNTLSTGNANEHTYRPALQWRRPLARSDETEGEERGVGGGGGSVAGAKPKMQTGIDVRHQGGLRL